MYQEDALKLQLNYLLQCLNNWCVSASSISSEEGADTIHSSYPLIRYHIRCSLFDGRSSRLAQTNGPRLGKLDLHAREAMLIWYNHLDWKRMFCRCIHGSVLAGDVQGYFYDWWVSALPLLFSCVFAFGWCDRFSVIPTILDNDSFGQWFGMASRVRYHELTITSLCTDSFSGEKDIL